MNIVFFTHPDFFGSQSMSRFANLLIDKMKNRGHNVEIWSPKSLFAEIKASPFYKKWLGYIDQYVVFPGDIRSALKTCPLDTLFVFTDNALGPWIPLVADRPHVIHCHDFLAQRSALGKISENPVGWTGRQYQAFIRRGLQRGQCFVSDSYKTHHDLIELIGHKPIRSDMEYIGLNANFAPSDPHKSKLLLSSTIGLNVTDGYLLHVGSEVWYKNRTGVIDIYDRFRKGNNSPLPLIMIGQNSGSAFLERLAQSPFKEDIYLLDQISDANVRLAYAGANLLLFPSLAEGFGWPIAEAMASGCPVITTNDAPMTEVAGNAAFLIPRRPNTEPEIKEWAIAAAQFVEKVLSLTPAERKHVVEMGLSNAQRFKTDDYIEKIETLYQDILCAFQNK